jgi:hypothetical protein
LTVLDLAKLAATPLEIKVGDKAFRLAPLTLGQLGEIEAWARREIFADLPVKLRAIGSAKLDKAEGEKLRADLVRESDRASRDPLEIARMMDSVAGQRLAFKLAANACQPVDDAELESICSLAGMSQVRKWVEGCLSTGEPANPPGGPAVKPSA